ncbi:MAG: hypothetical protein ACOH2F_03530 [Cellulomonas sp.]
MTSVQMLESFGTKVYLLPGLPHGGIYLEEHDVALIGSELSIEDAELVAAQLLTLALGAAVSVD